MDDHSPTSKPSQDGPSHKEYIRLFLESERELLRCVMVLIPNVEDARDVVQQAAVALWDKFDQYDASKPFVAWACRFALNEARMFIRKQSRRKRLEEDVVELVLAQRQELSGKLDARKAYLGECLKEMPAKQTEVVRAHYFDGLSVQELSTKLDRSMEAVYKVLQRTRLALQGCIDQKSAKEAKA